MPVIPIEGAVCRTCGEMRKQDDFYLRNSQTGNRFSQCRFCRGCTGSGGIHDNWYRDRNATQKECRDCKQMLPIESFYLLRQSSGQRRPICTPCHNRETLEHKRANREKVRASNAAYREANREALTERQRAWREAHPERYLAIHSGWKKRNPDAVRAQGNKRRVLVEQAGPHYTAAEWKAMKARYEHRCLMCKRQEPEIRLTVDHIVPISEGGDNTIGNLQPLCRSCNSKKHRGIVDLRPLSQVPLELRD
jgi:HNH endonuclease